MLLEKISANKDYKSLKQKYKQTEDNECHYQSNHFVKTEGLKEYKRTLTKDLDTKINMDTRNGVKSSTFMCYFPNYFCSKDKIFEKGFHQLKAAASRDTFAQLLPVVKKSEFFLHPRPPTNYASSKNVFSPVKIKKPRSFLNNMTNEKHSLSKNIQITNEEKHFSESNSHVNKLRKNSHTSCGFHTHHQNTFYLSKSLPVTSQSKRAFAKPLKDTPESSSVNTELFVYVHDKKIRKSGRELTIALPSRSVNRLCPNILHSRSKTTISQKSSSLKFKKSGLGRSCVESAKLRNTLNGDCLHDRLSLIHCYGNEYEKIAERKQIQHERKNALVKQKAKEVERSEKEKLKHEQRKKIYALNRLMTKMEQENFQQFMNKLSAKTEKLA